ncbi:hypothetical protein Tsubulata_014273 [Turnera subulata]|uniref:Pentacotripeptide-repeat region of PRORP domain-containing protein n=1 Tax=Turnera subulata TaxID=218843 RepID=A0A9Q0J697_9ROSI|nr:hypothetical protein Tsubulata_014273 [Turnera subulata]
MNVACHGEKGLPSFTAHSRMQTPVNPKLFNFSHLLALRKNTAHLKPLHCLLLVRGLLRRRGLLGQFLTSCFHLGAPDIALSAFYGTAKRPDLFLQNLMVRGLSDNGFCEDVLSVYRYCRVSGCPSGDFTFPFVIKACSALGAFGIGKELHSVVLRNGFERNVVIQTALVDFYGRTGHLEHARALVDGIPQPDLVSWNALISCYSFHGLDHKVFEVFRRIVDMGLEPNLNTLASVIPVCTRLGCLDIGMSLHGFAVKSGNLVNDLLVPALISLYARDGNLSAARELFDCLPAKNVAVWNAMIHAYTQNQLPFQAFEMFREMLLGDAQPNSITFVSIIPSCEISGSTWSGESLHAYVIKHGSENKISVSTALLSMYAKLGDISKAEFLFDWMPNRNILSWNAILSGLVCNGLWDQSLAAFSEMQFAGYGLDAVSVVTILSACSNLGALLLGKSVHAISIRKGIDSGPNVLNALLMLYSNCNHLAYSFELFENTDSKDVVAWNTLISACVHSEEREKAVSLVHEMQKMGVAMDLITLVSIIPICCDSANLRQGMTLHGYAIGKGFASDITLVNSLISMYGKCCDFDAGKLLFDVIPVRGVASWNNIITVYRHQNALNQVLILFNQMMEEGQIPDSVTLLNLLPACSSQLHGKSVHAFATRIGILGENPLLTSLMTMYGRFGNMNSCLLLFKMGEKEDISLWNAIISVHIQTKNVQRAVTFFRDLLQVGTQPDDITISCLILACTRLNSLNLAHCIMAYVIRKGFGTDTAMSNALIDLYARRGDILTARKLFQGLLQKDAISWNVMINGYSLQGNAEAALQLFSQMQETGGDTW